MSALRNALTRYVALRRALGTKLHEPARALGHFVEFLERERVEFITSELALRWAIEPQGVQRATWARRLGMVRGFASWFSTMDTRTEVPPRRLLAARRRRNKPHIFSEQEIERLMAEAARLASPSGFRAMTYVTLIGLLSATGLRPGRLCLSADPTWISKMGSLRFAKPNSGSLVSFQLRNQRASLLPAYAKARDKLCSCSGTETFLVSERGRPLPSCTARDTFARISCVLGLRSPTATGGVGRGPRLQDFRHCFATRRLIEWYRAGLDVGRELPKLATYLGHVDVAHTYEAVPELLELATEHLSGHQLGGDR
jgi:site-specific recombinase XerD